MRCFTRAVALLSLVASTLSTLTVDKFPGAPSDRFLVKVKDGVSKANVISQIEQAHGQITDNWDIINGFACNGDTTVLNVILQSPDVEAVSEDGIVSISSVQTNATWGLYRISHTDSLPQGSDPTALTYAYNHPNDDLGKGVDIYIVDTGILTTHETFGGRAFWGATFGGYANADGNGHGTHVAGTAGGDQYGVAKKATLFAVKVMSDQGSGSNSDVISGLDWVLKQATTKGNPSVVNMSLGGPPNQMLDDAVQSLTNHGVHVAVAAGNSAAPADTSSPARAKTACTVGASDINDARAYFSNWGLPVKVFAPGVSVTSAWIGSNKATNNISGTSMATPHVTGLIAYLIAAERNISPAAMVTKIQNYAVKNKLSNMATAPLTVNLLAHNRPSKS